MIVVRRVFVGLVLLASCAGQPEPVSLQATRELHAQDYDEVLARWTRKDQVYDGLDSKLFAFATFHSPEFRRAFLLRHTDVYGKGSEEASRLMLTTPDAEENLEFFFAASTSSPTWNDFAEKDSIWRITLEGDEGERVDGTVEKLKTTANLRVIYPFINDWARTYAVRFPRVSAMGKPIISAQSKQFTMRVASALGEARLTWKLIPSAGITQEEGSSGSSENLEGGPR